MGAEHSTDCCEGKDGDCCRNAIVLNGHTLPFQNDERLFTDEIIEQARTSPPLQPLDPNTPTSTMRFHLAGDEEKEFIDVDLDYPTYRRLINQLSGAVGEWAGIPIPLDHTSIRVEDRYPWKMIETLGGGDVDRVCSQEDIDEASKLVVRNHFYSYRLHADVTILQNLATGEISFIRIPISAPMTRLTFWLNTALSTLAWDIEAESNAMEKLMSLIEPHQAEAYMMTGTFIETSKRSGVRYLFRRLRPTIAMADSDHKDDTKPLRVLAALCLHPIAYYANSWAGAMVPTDDVVAHLLHMRGDEAGFWKKANQHRLEAPEAGI